MSRQVVSSTGTPRSGLTVICQGIWKTSDSMGKFAYNGVLAGNISIFVANGGGTISGCMPFYSNVVQNLDTQTNADVVIKLFPMVTVSVKVLDASGNPSPYAAVQSCGSKSVSVVNTALHETAGQSVGCGTPGGSGIADNNGVFVLSYLMSPTATVQIMATAEVSGAITAMSSSISLALNTSVVIILPEIITVGGHLVTSTGSPVSNVYLQCMGTNKYTDRSGYFSFIVPAGSIGMLINQQYTCQASNNGLIPCGWMGQVSLANLQTSNTSLVVTLPPIVTYQVFVVDDRDGTPIAGALVYPTNPPSNCYIGFCAEYVVGSGQNCDSSLYVGGYEGPVPVTSSNGNASIAFFQVNDNVLIGARDSSNSARAASVSVSLLMSDSDVTVRLPSPPSAPRNLNITSNGTNVQIDWNPPTYGFPLLAYNLTIEQVPNSFSADAVMPESALSSVGLVEMLSSGGFSISMYASVTKLVLPALSPAKSYVVTQHAVKYFRFYYLIKYREVDFQVVCHLAL